ncbi:phosphotransferase enzyme family protein [Actinophytocola oryzae]|nr:aminoglycoside phosphotransferase family protein [Actinophytocola oryzae]
MLSPPDGFTEADLVSALATHWGVTADSVTYRALGFGSHHWQVGADWFATVDESPDFTRLSSALRTAMDVPVAIAPVPTRTGEPLARTGDFAVTLYPYVDGESFDFGDFRDPAHRQATLDMVVDVHHTPPAHALTDDFTAPVPAPIDDAGPYSRPAARLLAEHAPALARLRARHQELAATVDPSRLVLTHGEPHPGNTMLTAGGWRLIDWDTALIAPPERDLWHLATPETLAAYEAATGVQPLPDLLELYRIGWDLNDLAEVAHDFSRPHTGTLNDDENWAILQDVVARL